MGLSLSPGAVMNGLVFYYDMYNTKSFTGAPTTNIVSNATTFSGWSNYWRTDYINTFTTEFGTTGYRITGNPSWNGVYKNFNLGSTGTYTFSAWFRYWGGTGNNNGATVYVSNYGGGDTAVGIDKSKVGIWQKISHTVSVTSPSNVYLYFISYGGDSSGRSDCSTWDITMPQIESGSFATGFVDGTRSNTQAIYDLTGQNTITATSLTYANDGTFIFNGSTNYLTIPNTTLGNGDIPWTISCWMKTTTTTNSLGQGSILSNISGGPVYSMMGVNNGKIVYWTYQNNAWTQKLGIGKTVNDGNWHMLTWVNNGNYTMSMYVDGFLDSNVANSTSGNNNPVDVIGRSWAGYFPGSIASLSRYTRSLSASEVLQNFNASRGRYGI